MAEKVLIQAIREAMLEEMHRDPSVFLMGEDVAARGGVFLATEGFLDEFGEQRVIDTPLAEASIVGVAVGAALNGMRPIAEIQFSDFIWPVVNQLTGEAARIRYGTNGTVGCPLVVRAPYGGGVRGGLYHSQSPEGFFFHTPGLKVLCPATPYDAKGLLKAAIRDDDPCLFLEHKRTYRQARGDVPDEDYTIPIGVADIKRAGNMITVVSYGLMMHYSLQAAEILQQEGISVEVVDLRSVKPIDRDTVVSSVTKTGKVLIVHEDNLTGGVGSEVAAIIAEDAFTELDAPIKRLCGPDVPAMGFAPTLEDAFMPNPEKIAASLRELAAY